MEGIIFFVLLLAIVLVLPVVAIGLAVVLLKRTRELSHRSDVISRSLATAREQIDELERRVAAGVAPAEPAAEPEPTATPVTPAEKEAPVAAEFDLESVEAPVVAPSVPVRLAPTPPAHEPPTGEGIERQFGTRIAVWLGAIALALAGGFLVKYSVEQGWIGPATRIVLGLVFGVSLLGVGEWIARRYANLGQGLDAAGIAVLYSVLLAGVRLYDLYPPVVAFGGMALTTVTAVVLSLRRGQLVAILGLLGGFLTPILIGSTEPRPWLLLLYLVMLQSGLLFVSWRSRWWPVAGLTLLGAMGWALLWMADLVEIGGATHHIGLLLLTAIVSFVVVGLRAGEDAESGSAPAILVWSGVGLGVVLLAGLVGVGEFGLMEWSFLGIVGAGCVVLGRLDSKYEVLAWIASLCGAGMIFMWGVDSFLFGSGDPWKLWSVGVALGALHAGGSYVAMWRSERPARWAALASVSGIAYLLASYGALRDVEFAIAWGVQALALAAVFVALAIPVARRRETLDEGSTVLAALAVAVTAFVSLAVPMELERAWITVAWAIEIPALAWIAARLRVPGLSKLAWLLGGIVAVRLLLNPAVFVYPIGEGVVLNWLLYGYGVPIVAFVVAALIFRRTDQARLADALELGAIALGFAFISLSIRQYFHPGDLDEAGVKFAEWGTWAIAWSLYGLGLIALYDTTRRNLHMASGIVLGWLAVGFALVVPGFVQNPLLTHQIVGGTKIFNGVLWVYGVPAILAVLFARMLQSRGLGVSARIAGSSALALGFLTLTLEVRQAFHGTVLLGGGTTNAEMYTYSLVWILFAIALLTAGIATRGTVLRYGSATVMAVAIGKVFLFDTAQLRDLYRVLSLFGLGVTLMVLAYLYQRFVFGESRT
ncbi:MAG: DUF2339 domain-containing protein [Acidobacteriota bacterium]|nr:DUF2339 domain-containing protein [Acidobacteriota bacterium]